jgi:O-antigen/teichoic acid export membrane protein
VISLRTRLASLRGDSLRARFASGAFWSVVGASASRGLTLLASVVAAHLLGTSGFGQLSIIQSTVGLVGVFAGAGLGLTATKHVAQYRQSDPERAGQYIALSVRIALVTGAITSGVLFVLSPWLASTVLAKPTLTSGLQVATGLVVFGAVNGVQIGSIVGLEEFRMMAIMASFRAALLLSALSIGAAAGSVTGAVVGLTAAEVLSAVGNQLALLRVTRHAGIAVRYFGFDREEIGILWRFSLPALLASLVTMPAMWIANIILISQAGGYAALGIYSAADKWRLALQFLPTSVSLIVLPILSNLHGSGNTGGYRNVLRANVATTVISVAVPGLLLAIFSPFAMSIYGHSYRSGWTVLVVLTLATIFMALNDSVGQVLVSAGLIWRRFFVDAALAVTLIVGALILIPRYGATGLAWSNLIAFTATVCVLAVVVSRHLREQESQV